MIAHVGGNLGDERLIERGRGRELHLDRDGIHRAVPGEHELIVGREPGEADQEGLDLGWIDVNPADDQHVVAAPGHAHHPAMGTPARARLLD